MPLSLTRDGVCQIWLSRASLLTGTGASTGHVPSGGGRTAMVSQCGTTKASLPGLEWLSEGHSQPQSTLWDQLRSDLGGLGAALPLLTPALLTRTWGGSPPGNLLPATLLMSLSPGTQPETQDQRRTLSSPHCFLEHQLEDQRTWGC